VSDEDKAKAKQLQEQLDLAIKTMQAVAKRISDIERNILVDTIVKIKRELNK
jgi:hypothetical protein